MGTVAMLMPNRQLAETAEKILAEGEFPYKAIVRTVDRTNALEVLKELPDIDLIISRGRIAMMIEEAVDIPVIPIISNAQEVGLLVLEAKRLSGKEMPLIALVGFENAYCDVSHFHELFHVEIRVYQAPFDAESNDVRQIVSRALADGVDAAICGSRSQRLWEEAGIPFVLFRTGEESLREAFHIARITHYAHELQKKNTARLQTLIEDIDREMLGKISANEEIPPEEARETAEKVALAALKYGDLSNQASKDYIFDIERFTSFEGDTGPYILYTIVRIKSILSRYSREGGKEIGSLAIGTAKSPAEKNLMFDLAGFSAMMDSAYEELAPHKVCAYIYQMSNDFNSFYHGTRILAEEDTEKKEGWIALLSLTERVLLTCIDVLGFSAPERM